MCDVNGHFQVQPKDHYSMQSGPCFHGCELPNPVAVQAPVPNSVIHYITKYESTFSTHTSSKIFGAENILVSSSPTALSSGFEVCYSFDFPYSSLLLSLIFLTYDWSFFTHSCVVVLGGCQLSWVGGHRCWWMIVVVELVPRHGVLASWTSSSLSSRKSPSMWHARLNRMRVMSVVWWWHHVLGATTVAVLCYCHRCHCRCPLRRPVHAERGERATRGLNRCVNHT